MAARKSDKPIVVGGRESRLQGEGVCSNNSSITGQPAPDTAGPGTTGTTSLMDIANKARSHPKHRFQNLYRMLNVPNLLMAWHRLNKNASAGIDRVTAQDYVENLYPNLVDLEQRLKTKRYRCKGVRRTFIPKSNGKQRPLGIPALEDKIVQQAVADILSAVYEADFQECSFAYRPGRGAGDAVASLSANLQWGPFGYVVESDIKGFFDDVDHDWLLEMLRQRIDDGALLSLIRQWLKAKVYLPDGQVVKPQSGTPQGGVISPVLANIENGKYGDEEKPNFKYDYLYAYNGQARGNDKFEKTGKKGFETALLSELKRIKLEKNTTPKVGIYLHGFNNNYQESIDEIFDLEKHLTPIIGYSPVIVGFSWPSTGVTLNYLSDREEVRDSVGAFTRFLRDINNFIIVNERDCFSTTFCIAHSMGNYLLRKGMEFLSDHLGTPLGRMMFDETVLLAPDLVSKDIEKDGKGVYITEFSRRVHVYYSKHDRALKASSVKRFGGNRLGRHGADDYDNLPENVAVINAINYANSSAIAGTTDRVAEQVSVHSSHRYHPKILEDVVQVISSVDRDQIKGRKRVDKGEQDQSKGNHYELI